MLNIFKVEAIEIGNEMLNGLCVEHFCLFPINIHVSQAENLSLIVESSTSLDLFLAPYEVQRAIRIDMSFITMGIRTRP